jgi:hypothetical protein
MKPSLSIDAEGVMKKEAIKITATTAIVFQHMVCST